MTVTKISAILFGFATAMLLSVPAFGQQFQPLIEPDHFQPDFQFFAPAEFNEYGGEPQPNTGWFLTYDRMYLYMSRPKQEQSYTEGDFTWGNRFDVGYMTEEDHGWLFTGINIGSPNSGDFVTVERLNRWVPLFDDGGGGGDDATSAPIFPAADRDDPFTLERTYEVGQSLNFARYNGFELNKTFRLEPLHKGSILEPILGFRYHIFRDYTRRNTYERFLDDGTPVPDIPNPDVALEDATVERFTSNQWGFTNHLVGGQLGVRWYKKQTRWVLNGEFRAFAAQNFQSMYAQQKTTTTVGEVGTETDTIMELRQLTKSYDHSQEFVFGFDVRAEAAYELTRDVALRFGCNFTEFGRGIGRGNNFSDNSQDLQMVAFTFGFTVNR